MRLNVVTTSYGRKSILLLLQTFLAQAQEDDRFVVLGDGWGDPFPELKHPKVEFHACPKSPPYGFQNIPVWWNQHVGKGEYFFFIDDDNVLLPGILQWVHMHMDGKHAIWYPFVLHDGTCYPFGARKTNTGIEVAGMKCVIPIEGHLPRMEVSDSNLYAESAIRWPKAVVPCFGMLHYATHASQEVWEALRIEAKWNPEIKSWRPEPLKEFHGC